jgi:hypothetical protein
MFPQILQIIDDNLDVEKKISGRDYKNSSSYLEFLQAILTFDIGKSISHSELLLQSP